MNITDGFVNVWNCQPHVLLLAGKIGHEGYFILDMIDFVELDLDKFRIFAAQRVHPLQMMEPSEESN